MGKRVAVVGAGLAGTEAAWQLAQRGYEVSLHEMRPNRLTPAHQTGLAGEMVCSNSFKSDDPASATGILKAELTRLDSLVLHAARIHRVPAGLSLAVDREAFARELTEALQKHPKITWIEGVVSAPDPETPTLLASGPLTDEGLASWMTDHLGQRRLFFYDAIAPIVEAASIDRSVVFAASRWGHGEPDFLNCPLDRDAYEAFVDALLAAPKAALHDDVTPFFEACLPIEVMAERGRETLRFGPMKPVGLDDPRTGRRPYAAVQLRQDTLAADHYNLVGFQTRLTWGAQAEVFRSIPGLEQAAFARFGSIHRNTYVLAPEVLDATLAARACPNLWIAGQLSGVEGYLESAAAGLAAAHSIDRTLRHLEPSPFPRETLLGALLHYLAHAETKHFAPVNAMLGLLPPLPDGTVDARTAKRAGGARGLKQARGLAYRERALAALEAHLGSLS